MASIAMQNIVLEDSTLDKNSMLETKEILWTVFVWTVPNYSTLQENVVYFHNETALSDSWTFLLTKTEEKIFITLTTTSLKQFVNFSIISTNGTRPLNDGQTSNFVNGKFVAHFCPKEVSDPESGYLENDILIVQCKYIEKQDDSKICIFPWDEHSKRTDIIKYQNDWREMYLRSRFCDFRIIVSGNSFNTHKVILAARSKYFYNMFCSDSPDKDKKEMWFRASPHVFHEVLMYMYTGELVEMGTRVMGEVFDIANRLSIKRLILRCQDVLSRRVEMDTVKFIYRTAKHCKNKLLQDECTAYINENCSSMLEKLDIDDDDE